MTTRAAKLDFAAIWSQTTDAATSGHQASKEGDTDGAPGREGGDRSSRASEPAYAGLIE